MVKRSASFHMSLRLFPVLGSGLLALFASSPCSARTLDNMEAERLTYSALVDPNGGGGVSAQHKAAAFPKSSAKATHSRPAAAHGRAVVRNIAYHPKHTNRTARIERAVYHRSGSYLLNRLSHLRNK